ncbi:MAG: response regulator transcription factor [Planctomycetota bacterium]
MRVAGLGAGADEVFSAPHTVREVEARTTALLRRVISDDPSRVEVEEGLVVDIGRLQIERGGRTIVLTPLEAGILDHMLRHGHRVVTRRELLEAVWGEPDQQACERTIDVHVVSLRRKLSGGTGSQRLIRTVRGRGYRWGA